MTTMQTKTRQGQFEVIESFAIKRRNEFYLIGQLIEGTVQEKWFVNVPINKSLAITVRITTIEVVEIASEQNQYKLLIVTGDYETLDLLLGLKIGSEFLDITIEGED
jgi:tmRNA-binding protein